MKIGVFATFMSPLATPGMIKDFGKHAEGIGLDSIWMGEHVALFDKNTYGYPSSKDGRIPVPPGGGMLDVTATFGFLAAVTSKVRFGTGVALVPQRNPIYTAKEMCTLDWLTEGRIDFGIGVGWNKEEVEACGYGWEDRGARCDEFMTAMRRMWTEDVVDFNGKWVKFETLRMDPKPIQKPHIPIIVGGYVPAAMRRAVAYGSGWYGFNRDPAATKDMLTKLDAAFAKAGRTRGPDYQIIITPPIGMPIDAMQEYTDLGVHRLVVNLGSQRPERVGPRMAEIATLVKKGPKMGRLDGKVALITGAGTGIGRATARAMAMEGAKIVVAEINAAAGEQTAQIVSQAGGACIAVPTDVTQEDSVRSAIETAVKHFGGLHILHNNAGGSTPVDSTVVDVPLEEFWRAIRLDLFGTFLGCRYGIPAIIASGGGSVINMASNVALMGVAGRDCYTAAKGGIAAITRSMAVEFASQKVRVNAIAPSATMTDRVRGRLESGNPRVTKLAAAHLVGLIEPDDIANMAVFLGSDESRMVTGHVYPVDSGVTIS